MPRALDGAAGFTCNTPYPLYLHRGTPEYSGERLRGPLYTDPNSLTAVQSTHMDIMRFPQQTTGIANGPHVST